MPEIGREEYLAFPGARSFLSKNNVRFYRTTFTLPSFRSIAADIETIFDNEIDVFVNGHRLAREGRFACNYGGCGIPSFRAAIAFDGAVSNGSSGGTAFEYVAPVFPAGNWNSGGLNEVVIAVNNLDDPYCDQEDA